MIHAEKITGWLDAAGEVLTWMRSNFGDIWFRMENLFHETVGKSGLFNDILDLMNN